MLKSLKLSKSLQLKILTNKEKPLMIALVFKTSVESKVHTCMLIFSQSAVLKLDASLQPEFPSLNVMQVFSIPVFGSYSLVSYVTSHCCL